MDNELTRQTAHVLLDMLSVQQVDAGEEAKDRAVRTAFQRLNEIGAVSLLVDDETGQRRLDVSALLHGSATLTWSLMNLLQQAGDPIDHQIIALRAHVDKLYAAEPE